MSNPIDWITSHPAEVAGGFAIASALFNVIVRFETPEEWIAFGESRPWSAAIIRVIRSLGIDPLKALNAIGAALKAQSEKAGK